MSRPAHRPARFGLREAICIPVLLAATAASAQTGLGDQKNRLVAAIEAAGCIVNERNQAAILVEANLTPEQGGIIVSQMMAVGEAEPLGDDLRLKTGTCK